MQLFEEKPFYIVAAPFYILTSNAPGFQFLHILTNASYSVFFFNIVAWKMPWTEEPGGL